MVTKMTIIILPTLSCNVQCAYCFAHGYQWVPKLSYNLEAILKSMEVLHERTRGDGFCLHGGECTQIPRADFEAILKKMFDLQGRGAVQTNCYNIDNDLIRLFKKYNAGPGVSIDGVGELNSLRGFPDKIRNREFTETVLNNIYKIREAGIGVGIITLLHKMNAGDATKLHRLKDFILMLRNRGMPGGRLNLMWTNRPEVAKYQLTPEEASRAWLYLYRELKRYRDHQWNPFREFTDNLLGLTHASCSMGKCDYFCTIGAKAILPDGSFGNCDRTHQEGLAYTRATDQPTNERYEVLKETDCSGCRFWSVCYGGCPSEGVDGDWRNKTRWCKPIYDLYETMETDIRGMFPNITLVTDYKGEDYYEDLHKGKSIDAFAKLRYASVYDPSAWKPVTPRKDNENHPHEDFTNQVTPKC